MDGLFRGLPVILVMIVGFIVWVAVIVAILRMDRTTREMLAELQKLTASTLLVHDLVEGPPVHGRPRIVRAKDHRPATPAA